MNKLSKNRWRTVFLALLLALSGGLLSACHDPGPAEEAGRDIDEALEEAGEEIDEAREELEDDG